MKIQDIGAQPRVGGADARPGVREPGAAKDTFSSILNEALSGKEPPAGAGAVAQADPVSALLLADISGADARKSCVNAVESAMGKLETVSTMLGKQNFDPKEVENLLGTVKAEADGLQEKLSALPEGDPLKQIGEELNVVAYTESMKWQRGDYL